VVLEFESLERAREWWASEDYRAAKTLRQGAALASVILAEGIEPRPR
jgi:uncharacterized protein (DUF1330 family)